ncbi:precorrin-2 dehydrogenase/sirohydrochlorin ferrochelatase family protein [Clostridium formicaceticum]|uniref:precorrin-2 dehydrogenase n=1 Tax=Clostridium formicaceticum TaxID=1497 RepID=A0AAC9WEG4_9CLOT|nr:bifunctional precorrin-2 dehydrogenase/sirohydrochlorin ferrochelatase [Clostridium formicaceticum]AOY75452.1 hypothetical protein BJL90_05820 [Clostridium formicaceticum]ARE85737.1 Siroheme synthase [Clostridium formicaceticum]
MSLYYPMMLKIQGKLCTVIGGGEVAERKVKTLLRYEAKVVLISPKITEGLQALVEQKKIIHRKKYYEEGDLLGSYLIYAVTDDAEINKKCKEEAEKYQILINVADSPMASDFIVPSSIERGSLTIAISTEGKSPMLSSKIKKELEVIYTEGYEEILDTLGEIRERALKEIASIKDRKNLFYHLVYEISYDINSPEKLEATKKKMWQAYESLK